MMMIFIKKYFFDCLNTVYFLEAFRLSFISFILLVSDVAIAQQTSYYGHFVGQLQLVADGDGVRMRLMAPYKFIDSSGGVWLAPAGTFSDGASIPQVAKSFVGGSWDGQYRNAAVIHDVACNLRNRPWELVHLMFYHAMLASGVSSRTAKIMYAAVYHFGPRWEPNGRKYLPLPDKRVLGGAGISGSSGASIRERLGSLTGPSIMERTDDTIEKATLSEFSRMASLIDEQEKSGIGFSIEQIQNLRQSVDVK